MGHCQMLAKVFETDVYYIHAGWWFQTFFIFHNIWDSPSH